ncbi:hypothetical protein Ahy_B05g078727 isoform B [Arachis hypogaea]|uniref:Uncharacterized protein n=1 Tax=Arachis hypogaea TaxID=3818 RepID=A0A444Z7X2_ARAHY|nr:hypothetical protein Ahy_B05g078727 isoform A [Arachis hypogaea]RYR10261.1 hypothetical protein Ahy_B05g078727 isoform B [Arachis hypogaea]
MEDYNFAMKRMMRNPYEYHHDLGLNYTLITDNLIVGSQPQKHEDIDHLRKEEGVTYILNLQQDKDIKSGSSTEFLNHFQNFPAWGHRMFITDAGLCWN